MSRYSNLFEYALRSLQRRWQKHLAVVAVYALVVGFFASVVFFTASLRQEAAQVLQGAPELWAQRLQGGRLSPMPLSMADSLQGFRGVRHAIPRIWGYHYDTPTGAVFTVVASDSSLQGIPAAPALPRALQPGEVLCGTGLLELRGLQSGEKLLLPDAQGRPLVLRIVGGLQADTDLLARDLLVVHPDDARALLGLQAQECTDLALQVANPREVDKVAQKAAARFPSLRLASRQQVQSTYQALFSRRGGVFVYGALVSVLAFLILAWDRAQGMGQEEKRELGILKGIGWEVSDVLWMKLCEGVIISVSATLLGLLLAVLHVYYLQAPLLAPFLQGWSVLYPHYQLQPVLQAGDLFTILGLAVVPYLSAAIIPAWKGAVTEVEM